MTSEWETEPDRVEFEHAGFKCLILRHPELKHLNGYVALPPSHPYYGKGYDDIPADVHGGLTFSQDCDGGLWEKGYWWIGFDTAHAWDLSPGILPYQGRGPRDNETYRNIEYVTKELKALAEQLTSEGILKRNLEE